MEHKSWLVVGVVITLIHDAHVPLPPSPFCLSLSLSASFISSLSLGVYSSVWHSVAKDYVCVWVCTRRVAQWRCKFVLIQEQKSSSSIPWAGQRSSMSAHPSSWALLWDTQLHRGESVYPAFLLHPVPLPSICLNEIFMIYSLCLSWLSSAALIAEVSYINVFFKECKYFFSHIFLDQALCVLNTRLCISA